MQLTWNTHLLWPSMVNIRVFLNSRNHVYYEASYTNNECLSAMAQSYHIDYTLNNTIGACHMSYAFGENEIR